MKFLQHIQEIDARLEKQAEEEHQKILFGFSGDMAAGVGLGMVSSRPNIFGGRDFYDNGMPMGHTTPNIFGGEDFHF